MKHMYRNLVLTATLLLFSFTSVHAHSGGKMSTKHIQLSGQVAGSLTCRGESAAGVLLYIPGESFSVRTREDGAFRIHYVPPGDYTLRGEIPDAGNFTIPDVKVRKRRVTNVGTVEICPDNGNGGGIPAELSGTYNISPTVAYACASGAFDLNISALDFQIVGSTLTVSGAPAEMIGTVTNGSFSAQGIVTGTVPETYTLNGSFLDENTWSGTLEVAFGGLVHLTDCMNQSFNVVGVREENGGVPPVDVSGIYNTGPITYACFFNAVNININSFEFQAVSTDLTVFGAPATMTGTIENGSFTMAGVIPGSVSETYRLVGTMTDENSWVGTFHIEFSGQVQLTDCTDQFFEVTGVRVTTSP